MDIENRKLFKLGLSGTGHFLFLLSFLNILASFYVDVRIDWLKEQIIELSKFDDEQEE